jgi:hypothetical protein
MEIRQRKKTALDCNANCRNTLRSVNSQRKGQGIKSGKKKIRGLSTGQGGQDGLVISLPQEATKATLSEDPY